jgi:DNA-binding transcriptional regulator YdaS (Cro superfamily)
MKLAAYLQKTGLSEAAFARAINAPGSAVHKWAKCRVHPSKRYVQAMYRVTGGLVGPADFYELPRLRAANWPELAREFEEIDQALAAGEMTATDHDQARRDLEQEVREMLELGDKEGGGENV